MESCRGSEFEIWLVTIIASLVPLACVPYLYETIFQTLALVSDKDGPILGLPGTHYLLKIS